MIRPVLAILVWSCVAQLARAADDQPATKPSAAVEMVDNPSYKAWSAYKAGTFVTHQGGTEISVGTQSMTSKMESTLKLLEITPDHVVIETSLTMETGGQKQPIPGRKQTIPAKIAKDKADLPPGLNYDQATMDLKETKSGKETLEVKGEKMETTFHEYSLKGKQDGQPMNGTMTVWTNDTIPGAMVKTESSMDVPAKMTLKMALSDFKVEK